VCPVKGAQSTLGRFMPHCIPLTRFQQLRILAKCNRIMLLFSGSPLPQGEN
jgi:hypothetical protein